MKQTPYLPESAHGASHGSVATYTIGFIASVVLTLLAYFIVTEGEQASSTTIIQIMSLGVAQLLVQLIFFLHLDKESKPRWNFVAFLFAAITVLILVAGSIWIMNNLDYQHPMSPEETDIFLIEDEGFKK